MPTDIAPTLVLPPSKPPICQSDLNAALRRFAPQQQQRHLNQWVQALRKLTVSMETTSARLQPLCQPILQTDAQLHQQTRRNPEGNSEALASVPAPHTPDPCLPSFHQLLLVHPYPPGNPTGAQATPLPDRSVLRLGKLAPACNMVSWMPCFAGTRAVGQIPKPSCCHNEPVLSSERNSSNRSTLAFLTPPRQTYPRPGMPRLRNVERPNKQALLGTTACFRQPCWPSGALPVMHATANQPSSGMPKRRRI